MPSGRVSTPNSSTLSSITSPTTSCRPAHFPTRGRAETAGPGPEVDAAAAPAAPGLQIAQGGEAVDHLAQVLLRDAVVARDLAHGADAAVLAADEQQHAQCVVGEAGELHGIDRLPERFRLAPINQSSKGENNVAPREVVGR